MRFVVLVTVLLTACGTEPSPIGFGTGGPLLPGPGPESPEIRPGAGTPPPTGCGFAPVCSRPIGGIGDRVPQPVGVVGVCRAPDGTALRDSCGWTCVICDAPWENHACRPDYAPVPSALCKRNCAECGIR